MKLALLVIDMQNGLVNQGPWNIEEVVNNIMQLINKARSNEVEVIYVNHTLEGHILFDPNSQNWKVCRELSPQKTEKLFRKNYSSSFRKTGLNEYLSSKNVTDIIVTGMQTDKCVDTSVRVAFENGFNVIIPEMTNTTYDNEYVAAKEIYMHHNFSIFNNRFAVVNSMNDVLALIEKVGRNEV